MDDLDPIPLADDERNWAGAIPRGPARQRAAGATSTASAQPAAGTRRPFMALVFLLLLSTAHGLAIWHGMGGRNGLTSQWPLWRDDHALYYHSATGHEGVLAAVGHDRRIRSLLHGGISQERDLPGVIDPS